MNMKDVLAFIEDADEDTVNCILDAIFARKWICSPNGM